jgi:hypothetical protein
LRSALDPWGNGLDQNRGEPGLAGKAYALGGSAGGVDGAMAGERAAVDDLDLNRAPVLEIGHPNLGAERQVGMGGGELALVEAAAARGAPAV